MGRLFNMKKDQITLKKQTDLKHTMLLEKSYTQKATHKILFMTF